MATVPMIFGVPFGAANTGHSATVQYKITDNTPTVRQAFTNTGVAEDADDPGFYLTPTVNVDLSWSFPLRINWKDTATAGLGATEFVTLSQAVAGLALPAAAPGTPGGLDTPISEAGTMQAGSTATTAVLRSGASATNKIYDGGTIQVLSGTGAGQSKTIAYYNGTTKTATIAGSWATTPDNTSVYAIRMANTPIIDTTGDLLAGVTNSTTVVLGSGASATDSIYIGAPLKIIAGTGAGQTRTITAYVGSSKTATVDHAYVPTPDTTSVYRVGLVEGAALNSSLQPVAASVAGSVGGNVVGSVGSVTSPVSVTGITPSIMQQLSAFAGSSSVSGNVITYVSQDGAHHFTQTFVPSIAAPTSIVWAQVD